MQVVTDPDRFYAGCWARASVRAHAYDTKGNKGVSFYLNNLQFVGDDEPLGSHTSAKEELSYRFLTAGMEPKPQLPRPQPLTSSIDSVERGAAALLLHPELRFKRTVMQMAQLRLGDCRDVLRSYPDNHFHALLTDPPAGISFLGCEWDTFRRLTPREAPPQTVEAVVGLDRGSPVRPWFADGRSLRRQSTVESRKLRARGSHHAAPSTFWRRAWSMQAISCASRVSCSFHGHGRGTPDRR